MEARSAYASVVFCVYYCLGSRTAAKELSKPPVSSAAGQQVSAPAGASDVTQYRAETEADESSDADGWDDAWDNEETWGDMQVRSWACLNAS